MTTEPTETVSCEPSRFDDHEPHTFTRATLIVALCFDTRESTLEWAQDTADHAFARVASGDTAFFPGNCPTCALGDEAALRREDAAVNAALIAAATPAGRARQRAENARINAENSRWDAHDDF